MSSKKSSSSPEVKPTIMEDLLGKELQTKAGTPPKPTKTVLKKTKLVGLYFSASWCPPCKTFSPILTEFYNALKKSNIAAERDALEIVYISSDKTVSEFDDYYGKMPWVAIPNFDGAADIKNHLAQTLKVQGIPMLVIIDAVTGEFVSGKAREQVTEVGGDAKKAAGLLDEWLAKERVPLAEANVGSGASDNPGGIKGIIMFFTRNPMYIFAIFYSIKWIMRKMEQMKKSSEGGTIEGGEL